MPLGSAHINGMMVRTEKVVITATPAVINAQPGGIRKRLVFCCGEIRPHAFA